MRKILPIIVLGLSLAARSLFGNPLESTILKETQKDYEIFGNVSNKALILDASLPMGNDWRVNFASDMEYDDSIPIINNVDMAIGNKFFYIGGSYGDLSSDTLTQNGSIVKVETGLKPFDWLDFSLTGALVNLLGMRTQWDYKTPIELYALGWNANLGKEFNLGSVKLFPWISTTGSRYWANPQNTEDFQKVVLGNPEDSSESMAYPFDHLNVKAGLDVKTKFLDFTYQGEAEGQFYYPSPFNFTNTLGMNMHDEERKTNVYYNISLITKPQLYTDIVAPLRNELQFDIGGFGILESGFFAKGNLSIPVDFLSPNQFNITAAIGKKFKEGSLELFYNSKSNTFGLQYSTQLDSSIKRESKARNSFNKLEKAGYPNYTYSAGELHSLFGPTLEDAVAYVKTHGEQGLSDLIAHIKYYDHDGTFSAKEEYEKGYGVCRDTNGNLIPYIESRAFNYRQVYAVILIGSFINHATTIIQDETGKFDIRDYQYYYDLNADTPQKAVDAVYPGAYIYGDGSVAGSVSKVRGAVERPLYDWKRFQ